MYHARYYDFYFQKLPSADTFPSEFKN